MSNVVKTIGSLLGEIYIPGSFIVLCSYCTWSLSTAVYKYKRVLRLKVALGPQVTHITGA